MMYGYCVRTQRRKKTQHIHINLSNLAIMIAANNTYLRDLFLRVKPGRISVTLDFNLCENRRVKIRVYKVVLRAGLQF